ncbi:septal ring lytic transglycosylase RlpA family protein [Xylophilus sp.]|uniref:septal ring lytic transglycosylase RlpA family protein n=1 Tax=Xylophilus sp. TaxID=2653893 RepID=UPI0013B989F5|nr:septal ring lytic transglycosylase RlpA family protein [Xylophilus sp.]KAF1046423.1 MAG: Endolytic peptidoglycan transglycosylase RlpA [Xylophilus sp.]
MPQPDRIASFWVPRIAAVALAAGMGCAAAQQQPDAAAESPEPAPAQQHRLAAASSWLTRYAIERGGASWYAQRFHQRRIASGERYDQSAFTAAHRTLPFGTRVCVHSLVNGREVMVRINDRGPYLRSRVIDVSLAAAEALGMVGRGVKDVVLTLPSSTGRACGAQGVTAALDTPEE